MNRSQELHNILLSVAVADALGSDIEFNPNPTQRTWLAEVNGTHHLRITDDTQMSLFTAEALLRGYKSNAFQEAYQNWYRTQVARTPQPSNYMLMQEALLYRQEAPGNTCMDSLRELYRNKRRMPNDSKGNGTIMRCFPLVPFITADNLEQLVSDCVYSTHDHVFAFWATKIAVLIGKRLSAELRIQRLLDLYGKHLYMMGLKHPRDVAHAPQYGGGWVAEEALGIALWALWNGKGDWLTTIELAVVHPGDSDTTGAVAGGFLGCMGVMPPLELQSRLEALAVIQRLLAHYPQGDGKDSIPIEKLKRDKTIDWGWDTPSQAKADIKS